jgi:hypothetical protein
MNRSRLVDYRVTTGQVASSMPFAGQDALAEAVT